MAMEVKHETEPNISIIAAVSINRVIGYQGRMPWEGLPEWEEALRVDLRGFRERTSGHVVIMGKTTYESIITRNKKPLQDRINIVVTSDHRFTSGKNLIFSRSLSQAILDGRKFDNEIYLIGGERIYKEGIKRAKKMYLTEIIEEFEGDRFFPEIDLREWKLNEREDRGNIAFVEYERKYWE